MSARGRPTRSLSESWVAPRPAEGVSVAAGDTGSRRTRRSPVPAYGAVGEFGLRQRLAGADAEAGRAAPVPQLRLAADGSAAAARQVGPPLKLARAAGDELRRVGEGLDDRARAGQPGGAQDAAVLDDDHHGEDANPDCDDAASTCGGTFLLRAAENRNRCRHLSAPDAADLTSIAVESCAPGVGRGAALGRREEVLERHVEERGACLGEHVAAVGQFDRRRAAAVRARSTSRARTRSSVLIGTGCR